MIPTLQKYKLLKNSASGRTLIIVGVRGILMIINSNLYFVIELKEK